MNRGGTNYVDKFVQCPYYKRVDWEKKHVVCEGVDGALTSRVTFETRKDLEEYMRSRCTTEYCLCAICRGIHEYWNGD